jgi:hypothetical protein
VIRLDIELPEDYKVNEEAPSSVTFSVSGAVAEFAAGLDQSLTGAALPVTLDVAFVSGSGTVTADVTLLYCRNDSEGLCIIEQVRFNQPVSVATAGAAEVVLPHTVQLPNF